jgi:hypothetical protein
MKFRDLVSFLLQVNVINKTFLLVFIALVGIEPSTFPIKRYCGHKTYIVGISEVVAVLQMRCL